MKKVLLVAALMLVCGALYSQKIKVTSQKAEDHLLSAMSYNIRHGVGMDGVLDLSRIAEEISKVSPDVVALQEVDKGTKRIGGVDSPAEIAKLAGGYYASFASAMDFGGGQYGNAILSKKKPLDVSSVPLPGAEEPRVMLIAEFDDYFFCSLHLSLDSASRVEACRMIAETAETFVRLNDKPFFIAGDFNLIPRSLEMRVLSENFGILSSYQLHTFPSDNPSRTLDYIMIYKGGKGKKLLKKLEKGKTGLVSWVQPESVASDHRPVLLVMFNGQSFETTRLEE